MRGRDFIKGLFFKSLQLYEASFFGVEVMD